MTAQSSTSRSPSMRASILVRLVVACCLLSACTAQGSRELLTESARPANASQIAGRHDIFVATTRARSDHKLEVFGGVRAPQTDFAKVDITVPAAHKIGQIERRRGKVGDQAKYFTATDVTVYNEASFRKALAVDIAKSDHRALVFIHGYNTAFDAAIYRMTQIVNDAGYSGTPVLFSWASGGKTVDYVYDNNSATAARDALEGTLRLVAASGARRIDIIAHSMGNWVTMEALRQLAITGDPQLGGRLGDVMLASPDIDVDVFKAQMARYGKPKRPFMIMLSGDDRALQFSRLIAGDRPRVGDYGDPADLAKLGVAVVDLSQVTGDRLGHTKFAENPIMIRLIGEGLKREEELPENERQVTDRVNQLTKGLGQTLTSAAEIVVTTPLTVLRIAVGQ